MGAPSIFKVRDVGKTLVNRTQGTRIASDGLKGRVYEVPLADLNSENDAERSFRKFKLVCEDVQGKNCLTNFYGMNLTTDKLRSMVKKWQTLIEAFADVKTTDGFLLRVFCIGFTQKQTSPGSQQIKKTCYAKAQQVRQIRKKMVDIITREVSACDLKEVVNKLIPDSIAKDIEVLHGHLPTARRQHQEGEGAAEAQVRPEQADGPSRGGIRKGDDRHHDRSHYRRGGREAGGIRAAGAGERLNISALLINMQE